MLDGILKLVGVARENYVDLIAFNTLKTASRILLYWWESPQKLSIPDNTYCEPTGGHAVLKVLNNKYNSCSRSNM